MKFATKIFIYIFLSTALIIGGMSMITHFWIIDHHMKTSMGHSKELAMLVASKSEDYILRNEWVELYQFFQSIVNVDPYIDYIFVEKQNEILVNTFEKGVPRGLLGLPPAGDPSKVDILPITDNQNNIIYHLRVSIGSPAHSTLHLGVSDKKIQAELSPHRNILLTIGAILLATIPLSLALFLARFVSKPLNILRNGVERIGSGELAYRLELPTGDEIEQLVHDINTMAEKLEKLQNGLKEEIADRIQAERELAKQSELLHNILQNVPHHVFWKNRESVYIGCNKAFAEAAGLENQTDVTGMTDHDLPWGKEKAKFYRECDRTVLETGTLMHDIEDVFIRADGKETNVIMSIAPLKDENGNLFGIMGICHDITERKIMEETIKQSQKMEAIGTLAGGIAHDFNNILGSIIGYTELAGDDIECDNPAWGNLQQVLASAYRAKELTRQILTFSRKNPEERKPIRLSEVVEEELKLLRSTLPTTIEIQKHIDDKDGMVIADPTQLHQIVMNLCTNAAQAIKGRVGRLSVSLSHILVIAEDSHQTYHDISPGPFIKLEISDTGTGIDEKIIHRVFEPFFTTKDKENGTGMGLAVVHGIIKNLGGNITIKSAIGSGTTFTILLPRVIHHPDIEVPPPPSEIPTGKDRILFVDDEKTLLDLGQKILGSLGYHVTAIDGSLEALHTYQQSPDSFDIIITDQTMPNLSGYELSRQILELNPSARILLCTGYSDSLTPEKVKALGIKALLYKPIARKDLARVVREVLDNCY